MILEKNNCKLLTTLEEFNKQKMNGNSTVEYMATCNHKNSIKYSHFANDGQGRLCKSCVNKEIRNTQIQKCIDDKTICQKIEYNGFQILIEILKKDFDFIRTCEGCIADCLVKPKNTDLDKWIPLQLKATQGKQSQDRYMFHLENMADNLILICISVSDAKCWIFDSTSIPNVKKLGISKKTTESKSKYDRFEVTHDNVNKTIKKLYESSGNLLVSRQQGLTPKSECCQLEAQYRLLRETRMNMINFEYPDIQCSVYDFSVNGFKIQEKVLVRDKGTGLTAHLNKQNGKGKAKIPYCKADNDFYWFHVPDTNMFYCIPETILIPEGAIDMGKKKMILYPKLSYIEAKNSNKKTAECNKFLFSYDNTDDIQRVINMLSRTT
jgi:hypothetical protein